MSGTITVKGIGNVSVPPDRVVLSMSLESWNMDYEKAMDSAAKNIDQLNRSLETVGFEKKAVKTTNLKVRTDYVYKDRKDGRRESVFNGYALRHSLKLEFDFDAKRLAETLTVLGACLAHPELGIAFTVKDPAAVNEEMLRTATANARRKAEILCDASGKQLGELLSVSYNWGEADFRSPTRYELSEECLGLPGRRCESIEIEPEDLELSDTVTFVWEIR